MPLLPGTCMKLNLLLMSALALCLLVVIGARPAAADLWNPDTTFAKHTKVVSFEGGLGYFSDRLPAGAIQEWNVAARFSLLPFNPVHLNGGWSIFDGAFEIGLQPTFERFCTKGQNWGGLALAARYYLTDLRFFDRVVPWVGASAAPGGSDLDIGRKTNGSRLRGPFLVRITGEAGLSYFFDDSKAVYIGLQGTHFSNAYTQGGSVYNNGLNTPWAGVIGFSWFIP
jgi:Lipid A 3-O-deacylase (PagL)